MRLLKAVAAAAAFWGVLLGIVFLLNYFQRPAIVGACICVFSITVFTFYGELG